MRGSLVRCVNGRGGRYILAFLPFPYFPGALKTGSIDLGLRELLQQFDILFFLEFVFLQTVSKETVDPDQSHIQYTCPDASASSKKHAHVAISILP